MDAAIEPEPQTTQEAWADAAAELTAALDWEQLGDPYQHTRRAPLTLARKAEILSEARDLRTRRADLVEEKRDTAKRLGTAIEALDDQLDELLERASLGELTTTKVQREIRAGNVRVVDVATGEVIEERAATQAELQRDLFAESSSEDSDEAEAEGEADAEADEDEEHELGGEG